MKTIHAAGIVVALSVCACGAGATITVDANTAVVLGDQSIISGNLLGITAFEGFPSVIADRDYRSRLAALRPGCIRFGGGLKWFCPTDYDPSWYSTPSADSAFEQTLLFGARYPFGRFLPVVRQMGAEPMLSLGGPPEYLTQEGTSHPSDFDQWAEYCAEYVGLWKRFDPALRLVQIWNEPNASWYNDPRVKGSGKSSAQLHIEMAQKVGNAIKQRAPDVLVGGPVLCWPPAWPPNQKNKQPWYTWQSWTVPWLAQTAEQVDFFDFHVYDVSPDDLVVQTEMTHNQALLSQGRHLPIWITESSYNLSKEEQGDPRAIWLKRLLPYERLLLRGVLPQADKIAGNLYHDLHASHHTLLPGSAFEPDPMYWLLWILRDLRGTRIVADSDDAEVLSYATVEQDRVSVVLFNDGDAAADVALSVSMPTGYATGPYVRAIGRGPSGACERLTIGTEFTRQGGSMSGTVPLPAQGTVCLNFHMQSFARPRRTRAVSEHFGDKTLQLLAVDAPVEASIDVPAVGEATACLRLGLLGLEGDERLKVTLNGAALAARATAVQDIPVDMATLRRANKLVVGLSEPAANRGLALGFASIVLQTSGAATE